MKEISMTDIKGIQIGQAEDEKAGTGCTVILCKEGATAGVDVRGGGPATRETDLLNPINMVQQIHAVMLSGGSAFGLDAASGAMQYLEEQGCGFDMQVAHVPIVCGAALFDLSVGDAHVRPDKQMGYQACVNSESLPFQEGNHGVGTGASVGKLLGFDKAMKSGIGMYGLQSGDVQVAAVTAVNACGNVVDYQTNEQLAGVYLKELQKMMSYEEALAQMENLRKLQDGNTTIACVVTNAKMDKAQCTKIAGIAHNGYARAIHPVHTMSDGDTIFVLSTNEVEVMPDVVGILATEVIATSIRNAVLHAEGAYGLLAHKDIIKE